MNSLQAEGPYAGLAMIGTSGGRISTQRVVVAIVVAGTMAVAGTSGAEPPTEWGDVFQIAQQTNSGYPEGVERMVPRTALMEIRRRGGLTWDELGRLFGVSRRSVHFWVSGQAPSAVHQVHIGAVLQAIRGIDRGSSPATRTALFAQQNGGKSPFQLLAEDRVEELMRSLGSWVGGRSTVALSPLSPVARAARRPLPPVESVGAFQDVVHRDIVEARAARTGRTGRQW